MAVDTYLCGKLATIEATINAYEAAELALVGDGALKQYQIDTGQTKQTVTANDLADIRKTIDSLYNQRSIIRKRCGLDSGSIIARPGW